MVDYRKFLGKTDVVLAPWFGGASIDAPGRRLRVGTRPTQPGWYRFELKGRIAHVVSASDADDLSALPRVRGFIWKDRLVGDGARAEPVQFLPADEPPRFAPITARRWHGGALLFEGLEFESEAEGAAREALATGSPLSGLKGVPAPLRAAYGYALIEQASRRLNVPVASAEVRAHVGRVAEGGAPVADEVLRALVAERVQSERELRELRARLTAEQLRAELEFAREQRARARAHRAQTADERAFEALEKAGATFESARRAGEDQLEVVFAYLGERFISLVDADTLQVIDSGICLGHPPADRELTLDSLPSVIKEAIDTDRLVILRAP